MITDFKLIDYGVVDLDEFLDNFDSYGRFQCAEIGIGSDAESALDDLLQSLSDFFDVTGLEGRIKSEWDPNSEEGDCDITYYCLRLLFNESNDG